MNIVFSKSYNETPLSQLIFFFTQNHQMSEQTTASKNRTPIQDYYVSVKFLLLSVISCYSKIFVHWRNSLLKRKKKLTRGLPGSRTCIPKMSSQGTSTRKKCRGEVKEQRRKGGEEEACQEKWLLWVFLWQCLSWLLWGVRTKQSASILPQKLVTMRSPSSRISNTWT